MGLKNSKVISKQGKTVKEFIDAKIEFLRNQNNFGLDSYFKLWNKNRKGTLINSNGDFILKPEYDYISFFNNKGQIIAFKNEDIFIFNNKGQQLNKVPLKYKTQLYPIATTRFPLLKDANTKKLKVIDNQIICSLDGINYGVYSLKENKVIIPFKYDMINSELLIKEKDTIAYKVFKKGLSSLVDYHSQNEMLPYVFEEITTVLNTNGKTFIEGNRKTKKGSIINLWVNYLDLETKKLVFPKELNLYKATPINQKFWIVTINNSVFKNGFQKTIKSMSIYNIQDSRFIEKPVLDKYSSIDKLSSNLVLFNTKFNGSWIYDLVKKEKVALYTRKPSINKFKLKKANLERNFFIIRENGKNTLYDEEFNIVFKDLSYNTSFIEADRFIIKERIDNKYVKTAYDINGNIIGEKYKYK